MLFETLSYFNELWPFSLLRINWEEDDFGRKNYAAQDIGLKHNEMAKIDRKKDGRQELLNTT